ncbi:hypothetical protein KCH_16460 [Kitasatospora cheerisanensis KCTC 2395]|uniref:Uncharacterized protein n=1 Tax=Kitasatospora cheerisanensis KCTC 2395 TaxID=1348663 RepID=A0A066Z8P3_9ACTN|nr:hypothetical protein KCH_16460 [Kitasatospora cheerisanensis KCTC 2395]
MRHPDFASGRPPTGPDVHPTARQEPFRQERFGGWRDRVARRHRAWHDGRIGRISPGCGRSGGSAPCPAPALHPAARPQIVRAP